MNPINHHHHHHHRHRHRHRHRHHRHRHHPENASGPKIHSQISEVDSILLENFNHTAITQHQAATQCSQCARAPWTETAEKMKTVLKCLEGFKDWFPLSLVLPLT